MTKYHIEIQNTIIVKSLSKIINQVYRLLPLREEGADWRKPLYTVQEELAGMQRILGEDNSQLFFSILCKLEGLSYSITFEDYRRSIFDCLSLLGELKRQYETI